MLTHVLKFSERNRTLGNAARDLHRSSANTSRKILRCSLDFGLPLHSDRIAHRAAQQMSYNLYKFHGLHDPRWQCNDHSPILQVQPSKISFVGDLERHKTRRVSWQRLGSHLRPRIETPPIVNEK